MFHQSPLQITELLIEFGAETRRFVYNLFPRLAEREKEAEFYAEIRAAIKRHSGEELDIKPYEADMRHLLNTYIHADPAADLGELANVPLTELIIETGIHDAIARKAAR